MIENHKGPAGPDAIPTKEERSKYNLRAFKGVDFGLGQEDPVAIIAMKLEEKYPSHLILVQSGNFLHGFGQTAYALSVLKKYKLKLVGTSNSPQLRVGFPLGNFKRRLWTVVEDFGVPYVVALGRQDAGRTIFESSQPSGNSTVLDSVSPKIVEAVINELKQYGELNKAAAKILLAESEYPDFKLKSKAEELDTELLRDCIKMPRDIRATYGENIRQCQARLMKYVMAYGQEDNKPKLLKEISAEVDLLKHYLAQAPKLNGLKIKFESRVTLIVELGKIVGGLLNRVRDS